MAETKRYDSGYDPREDPEYRKLAGELEAAQSRKPVYQGLYEAEAQAAYDRLRSRKDFSYDVNADALYRQYRDQYSALGRAAMEDTMGRAQAMTGGYANSYAQTAGQQAYEGYLGKLNEQLPQLYDRALERYRQEGEELQDRYEQAQKLSQQEYDRHQDDLDRYRKDVNDLQSRLDSSYQQGYQRFLDGYKMEGDAYSRLANLIRRGYNPTGEELRRAGMTAAQANALRK